MAGGVSTIGASVYGVSLLVLTSAQGSCVILAQFQFLKF